MVLPTLLETSRRALRDSVSLASGGGGCAGTVFLSRGFGFVAGFAFFFVGGLAGFGFGGVFGAVPSFAEGGVGWALGLGHFVLESEVRMQWS